MEIWKEINGYEVSNEGRVRSLDKIIIRDNGRKHTVKGKLLHQWVDDKGYLRCGIGKIHKLVAKLFVPNPNNYEVVHHIDHDKLNNNAENLEWVDDTSHNRMHGGQHPCKIVYKYDDFILIDTYNSVQEAARKNNISYSNIARCCRGEQKTYKGHIWSYEPL